MNKSNAVAKSIMGGLIACSVVAYAQETKSRGGNAPPTATRPSVMQGMADQLNLTDKQKQAMKLVLEEHRAKLEGSLPDVARTREQNRKRRKELQQEYEAELRKLGQDGSEILNARKQMKSLQGDVRDKLKSILTPQQWEQWGSRADAGPEILTNSIGMKLKRIPAGSFMMGMGKRPPGPPDRALSPYWIMVRAALGRYSRPIHKVTLTRPFYMGVYEVTQRQYREIMGKGGSGREEDDNYPVANASWFDAQEFCLRLSIREGVEYRLPTEAEWEYACRAGTTTEFYWGDEHDPAYCWAHDATGQKKGPAEVGQKKPNAWGLYDMSGNVEEWCEDRFSTAGYPTGDQVDPLAAVTDESNRLRGLPVLRGGSWCDPQFCASGKRHCSAAESREYGFRIVRAAE